MKRILILLTIAFGLSACGPHMYSTRYGGQDNNSFVIVITNGGAYENISIDIDGTVTPIQKVYKVKAARKAHPVITTPGKHTIKVLHNGKVIINENVFLGLQETKKIVLQ